MLDKIERIRHIHATGEDIRPVPHVVADGLDHTPSTHRSRATGLVCKLKFIETQCETIEGEDDPINEFEYQTTDRNGPIVLTTIYTSKFVLNDWYESCQEEEQCHVAVDQETLDGDGEQFIQSVCPILDAIRGVREYRISFIPIKSSYFKLK